jgi:hypothetical protein
MVEAKKLQVQQNLALITRLKKACGVPKAGTLTSLNARPWLVTVALAIG